MEKNNNYNDIKQYKLLRDIIMNGNKINKKSLNEMFKENRLVSRLIELQINDRQKLNTLYKKSINSYENILFALKKLSEELNIEEALLLSNMFTYLLWNGFFSPNRIHNYSFKNQLLLPGLPFEIFDGKGICLNYSTFLKDFLETCDKKSTILSCKVDENSIITTFRPDIGRNVNQEDIKRLYLVFKILKPLINKYGNHVLNLIEDNNKLYAYDTTKLYVFNIKKPNELETINGIGTSLLKTNTALIIDPLNDKNNIIEKIYENNFDGLTEKK